MRDLTYTRILTAESSFQLVRTNPKLTGNLKVTINEAGEMWLNSIRANAELSKDDYSRFPIDVSQSLASNIYRFFKDGTTPNEIVFSLSENTDLTKTSKDLKDQYDFSNYFSGVKYFPSNKYSEKFSYFAPIYLRQELPRYFVIFKIKDPLNSKIDISKQNFESGQSKTDYLIDLFKKATIIKTFDLSEDSTPGKFIRDYLRSPNFPTSPLTVSFSEEDYTTWNGILIDSGIMGSRGELLYSQYINSTPLKFFEENITKGFERNGVILPNILNLEFIFDDPTSKKYEINRYLGVYLDKIEISKLDIDLARGYSERGNWENTPRFRQPYYEYQETRLEQENPNGVVVPYSGLNFNLLEFSDVFTDSETLYFNYLTDKFGRLHLPKLVDPYDVSLTQLTTVSLAVTSVSVDSTEITATAPAGHPFLTDDLIVISSNDPSFDGSYLITKISDTEFRYTVEAIGLNPLAAGTAEKEAGAGKLRLSDEKIDLGEFFGPSRDFFLQDTGFVSYVGGRSYSVLTLNSILNHGDEIRIYHPNGTRVDANGKHDLFTATSDYSLIPDDGDFYFFNDYDNTTGYDVFYFSSTGRPDQVATAIAGCINNVRNRTFTAYAYNEHVFIICNVAGDFDASHRVSFTSPQVEYGTLAVDGVPAVSLVDSLKDFRGGSKAIGNRLVIDRAHFDKISQEQGNILVKTKNGWSKIKKLSNYVDLITEENQVDPASRINAIGEYLDKMVVTLELEDEPTISYTRFVMRKKFRPSFGLLSIFPIKDLDFDFYSSDYLNFPEIDLYQYYFVPPGVELLAPGSQYRVAGGTIEINGVQYADDSIFSVLQQTSYSIVSGGSECIVYYYADSSTGSSLTVPIQDENRELLDFPGFSILKDPTKVVPQNDSLSFILRTKYINGLTETEYDFFKENESSDFALRSKIIPYITKWGIKGGFDSRDNPYRLNSEIVFGRNNFAPDHQDQTQNPENFTHEWFYIESKFNYLDDPEVSKKNNYYFDTPIDLGRLVSEPDYFLEYFTYTPYFGNNRFGENVDIAQTQFRYSTLFKNRAGEYETFFKGFKITFKDVTDPNTLGPDGKPLAKSNTSRFDGYRFSCILKPVKEVLLDPTQPPIKYRVIEHKDFKFIVVVIELSIGHLNEIDDYWKEVPFSGSFTKIGRDPLGSSEEVFFADPNYPTEFGSSRPFETINGDYRIAFDQVDGEDVSNLTHALLYSLKHKKFNSSLDNFANIKLSSKLKTYNTGIQVVAGTGDTQGSIRILENPSIPNYPISISDELVVPRDLNLVGLFNVSTSATYFLDQRDEISLLPRNLNPIINTSDFFANFQLQQSSSLSLTAPTAVPPYTSVLYSPLSGLNASIWENLIKNQFSFFVLAGGEKYFEKLAQKLSFSKFKSYVNSLNPVIEYSSYSLSQGGTPILNASPNFYLDLPDQVEIDKANQVVPIIDEDRPTQFSFVPVVSYKYEVGASATSPVLNRYKGEYEPIARDVFYCRSNFKFIKNRVADLNLSNTKLNTRIDSFLTLLNFNHIKVADTKILELESDPAYLPVYPKIDEVAIGKNQMFLLSSNWDWGFHQKYSSKSQFSPVSGAIRVEEDENFLGKVISLPDTIELQNFNVTLLGETQKLEDVDLTQVEIVAKEGSTSLSGFINVNNVLTTYLISDGIEEKFTEFLVNSSEYIGNFDSIQSYVREYIRLNILKLYDVESVEFFSKKNPSIFSTQDLANSNLIQFVFLDDQQRFRLGYSNLKNVQINKPEKLILNFSIQKQLDAGLNISPKVKIKFI